MTPLHYILLYSPPSETLRKIIDLAPNAAEIHDNYGELPLHCACNGWNTAENLLVGLSFVLAVTLDVPSAESNDVDMRTLDNTKQQGVE